MESENKLVFYTVKNKTIHGMLVQVGKSNYFLHNEKDFPGNGEITYDPWIEEFGETYKYYIASIIMKNITIRLTIYELWD